LKRNTLLFSAAGIKGMLNSTWDLDQLNLVPISCDGVLDAPTLAARVRRRSLTFSIFYSVLFNRKE
jgi:hypothetical protein